MNPEKENQCVEELRRRMSTVPLLPDEPDYATDTETLRRYLVARDWKLDDAEKMLKGTVEWRRDYKPLSVDCRWCHERPGFHCMRQVGFDKQNRPVMYACFAQQTTKKNMVEDTVAHCVYLMENVVKTMKGGASKMVWVLDCTGMTMASCNPKLGYGCSQIFANMYPERLALMICVNHSPVFQGVWKAIKVFLDPNTANKVQLTRSKDKINKLFNDIFPPDMCQWLKEEIELNKQKKMPQSQKHFWEFPLDPKAHDPRGCADYIMNYIEPYIVHCSKPEMETRSIHRPHPSVIDRLKGDVAGVNDISTADEGDSDSSSFEDLSDVHLENSSGSFDEENGACAEIEIPDEYKIDITDESTVTHM